MRLAIGPSTSITAHNKEEREFGNINFNDNHKVENQERQLRVHKCMCCMCEIRLMCNETYNYIMHANHEQQGVVSIWWCIDGAKIERTDASCQNSAVIS